MSLHVRSRLERGEDPATEFAVTSLEQTQDAPAPDPEPFVHVCDECRIGVRMMRSRRLYCRAAGRFVDESSIVSPTECTGFVPCVPHESVESTSS